jgi:hypothetical protein
MPFADQRGAAARLLQQRRQGRVGWRQADILGARRIDRLLEADRETILIASGSQGRACRRADRGVGVALREFQPLDCQAVYVWRRVVVLTVAAHISVAEVIRHDEDDVRPCRLRPGCAAKANPCQGQRTRGSCLDESTTRNCALLRHVSPLLLNRSVIGVNANILLRFAEAKRWRAKKLSRRMELPVRNCVVRCWPRGCRDRRLPLRKMTYGEKASRYTSRRDLAR